MEIRAWDYENDGDDNSDNDSGVRPRVVIAQPEAISHTLGLAGA